MKLGRFKKSPLNVRQEALAEKIAGRIVQGQRRLADYLNQRTAGLSAKTLLVLLILFCAGFGTYLGSLLMQAIN